MGVRGAPEWTFPGLIMMLGGPICSFLIAHLLFPEPVPGANIREYYYGAMRPIWWLAFLAVLFATLFRPLVLKYDLFTVDNATSFIAFIGFIVLAISPNRVLHALLVPILLLTTLLDVLLITFTIG
jgi:hypothetical protein